MPQKTAESVETLTRLIVDALQDKKGVDVVMMDLRKLKGSVSDFFVLVTGTSDTHVKALADSVEEKVRKEGGEKPLHIEGKGQGEWILLDYVNVVVHVFLREKREFFNIEELWGDAEFTEFPNP